MNFMFMMIFLASQVLRYDTEQPRRMLCMQWVWITTEETPIFQRTLKTNQPTLCLTSDIIIIIMVMKQIFPLSQRETLFLSSKIICYTSMLEKDSLKQKLIQNVQNCHRELSSNRSMLRFLDLLMYVFNQTLPCFWL